MLRVRRIRHYCINSERLTYISFTLIQRPVFFKRVGATCVDVSRIDSTHHEIHTSEVVCILLQLLGIVFHAVLVLYIFPYRLSYGDKQRSRPRSGIVNLNLILISVMFCHNQGHKFRHFMWSIELASLLACTCGKVRDKIFIHISKHVISLLVVGRNILYEFDKVFQGASLSRWVLTEL